MKETVVDALETLQDPSVEQEDPRADDNANRSK